ncbi:hypothetical protein NLM59_04335 [Weeksellaceae bacterium KMM 9724]|uniref:hypothetical protein n=1 Tax=Profundicola chukchiensis TaxID=2961959 RepID=UPI00243B4920|nr:hypothetical protein [Profundicola chukchiensis]MDG4950142.1 hypothetical protein [Profundicola chukchiensis]
MKDFIDMKKLFWHHVYQIYMFSRTDYNPLQKTKEILDSHIFSMLLLVACIPIFYFGWILDGIAFFRDTNIYNQKSTWALSWMIAIAVGLISLKLFKPMDKFIDEKIDSYKIAELINNYEHLNKFFNTIYQIFFILLEPFILILLILIIIISAKYFVWIPNGWVEEDWLFKIKLNI